MTLAHSDKVGFDSSNRPRAMRLLQFMCALLITYFALWFLFGIPAYLFFGVFFE